MLEVTQTKHQKTNLKNFLIFVLEFKLYLVETSTTKLNSNGRWKYTEGDRNKDRSTNKSKAKIFNEAQGSNLDEDQMANLCMENWPGEVYTNTLVTRGNIMEDDSGKDAIIIIQPTIAQNEDGTEKFLNVPPEVKAIVKGKELRSSRDIVQYTTKATP